MAKVTVTQSNGRVFVYHTDRNRTLDDLMFTITRAFNMDHTTVTIED